MTDIRDMLVVHTAMLREFRLAPAAVTRTGPGDRRRAHAVARHLNFVCGLLHHHHHGEDELLWPLLQARTPTSARPALDAGEAQHAAIDATLNQVSTLLAQWSTQPDLTRRDQLADALTRLHHVLSEHLDLEERLLLPLAAVTMTQSEWDAIGEAAAAMPKPALALAFGMFAYEADPVILAGMLKSAPAVPRRILPVLAPALYARRARAVHGTSRP